MYHCVMVSSVAKVIPEAVAVQQRIEVDLPSTDASPQPKRTSIPDRRNGIYFLKFQDQDYRLPSVTSITSEAMPKPQLMSWAARTAARAALNDPTMTEEQAMAVIYQSKAAGGDRGALIHDFAEASDNGHTPDINSVPEAFRGYAQAFLKFQNDITPRLVMNEQRVANFTHGYAGRLDRIYDIKGELWLVDYKTSKDYYPEMGLQLAAYKNAEFTFKLGGEYTPMPKVARTAIVLLSETGTYTLKETDEQLEVFMALKKIWLWLNADKLKRLNT